MLQVLPTYLKQKRNSEVIENHSFYFFLIPLCTLHFHVDDPGYEANFFVAHSVVESLSCIVMGFIQL